MLNEPFTERRILNTQAYQTIQDILLIIQKDAQEIKNRVISIEYKQDMAASAFIKNDLGLPDYDGHRKDHLAIKKSEETLDKYKFEFTKSLLKWGGAALAALLFSGVLHKIALFLGIPGV